MKNNDFKKMIKLKDVLDDASSDQIDDFIEKNKNSNISEDVLENIKAKVFEKTGIENKIVEKDVQESIVKKDKKVNFRGWFTAAACIILAVALAIGGKYINFGNHPSVLSEDDSGDKSTDVENSNVSEIVSDESQNTSADDNFEIKGINWGMEIDKADRVDVFHLVRELLWDGDKTQYTWATVVLNKLTPLGAYELENKSMLYQSVAEIKVVSVYNNGDTSVNVNDGEVIQIIVDWIVRDGEVLLSHYVDMGNGEKGIYCLPMTEIGQKYVLAFADIENKEVLGILEKNNPEIDTRIGSFTSYPVFSVDFSEIKGLNEYKVMTTWAYMYATVYEWYMKDKVSQDSNEYKLYDMFDDSVRVPEKPENSLNTN